MLTAAFAMTGLMACGGGEEEEEEGKEGEGGEAKTEEVTAQGIADDLCACTELEVDEMEACMDALEEKYPDVEGDEELQEEVMALAEDCMAAMMEKMMGEMDIEESCEEGACEEGACEEGACEEGACEEGACEEG